VENGGSDPGMRQVVGFADRSMGKGTFGGAFGAHHCIQWGHYGNTCVTVPQPLELQFGVVGAVGRGTAVLDEGQRSPAGRKGFGGFCSPFSQ